MEQYYQHPLPRSNLSGEEVDKCKTVPSRAPAPENNSSQSSGGFDCNICLDLVQDPVVTFCGHLYCWRCIYRWIRSQRPSPENPDQHPQCPVCKTDVSQNTLIPLYGRGQSSKVPDGKSGELPQRPTGPGCDVHTLIAATTTSSNPNQQLHHRGYPHQPAHQYYFGDYPQSPSFGFAGTTTFHPMIGMFGEMIYARIFGNSQTTLYTYPNTYSIETTNNPRIRRHVMQVDRSLSRVSFFLCCCIIVCLLLF